MNSSLRPLVTPSGVESPLFPKTLADLFAIDSK